jgi:hypothetical protein
VICALSAHQREHLPSRSHVYVYQAGSLLAAQVATASGSETTSVIGFAGDSRTVAFVEALWQRACDVPSRHGFCRITGELLEAICCC